MKVNKSVRTFVLVTYALVLSAGGVQAGGERRDVLLLGDSIASGGLVARNTLNLQGRLERLRRTWFIANASRPGMTIASGGNHTPYPPVDPNMIAPGGVIRPNVVVMLGVNDYVLGVPLDNVRAAYDALANVAHFWGVTMICVTPIWCGSEDTPNGQGLVLGDYRAAITDVCAGRHLGIVDGSTLVPHQPTLYADLAALHPNASGYAYMGRALATALDPLLAASFAP